MKSQKIKRSSQNMIKNDLFGIDIAAARSVKQCLFCNKRIGPTDGGKGDGGTGDGGTGDGGTDGQTEGWRDEWTDHLKEM